MGSHMMYFRIRGSIPGDELFTGTKHELVQVIDMDFSRAPRPRSVTSTRDGTASETNSVIMG